MECLKEFKLLFLVSYFDYSQILSRRGSTIPFGRSAGNAFGFASAGFSSAVVFRNSGDFGGTISAPESPTSMTPTPSASVQDRNEKSYFNSHNRGDSVTSVESAGSGSTHFPNYSNCSTTSFGTFAHSTQSLVATTSTGFNKKASFASFRNTFKSGKSIEPPPVP